MKHEISVSIGHSLDQKRQTAIFSLHFPTQTRNVFLDINGTSLLNNSSDIPDLSQDFLLIASCIYAVDKAILRRKEADHWTRYLAIEIPVEHDQTWNGVAEDLSYCVGFLTGDVWEISFRHGEKRLVQKKRSFRRERYRYPNATAVSLFSGGLDSLIGTVDWLSDNPDARLLLVSHYDRNVGGPKSDQIALKRVCSNQYRYRFNLSQTQIGLSSGSIENSFRSRSLLFLALGCYYAEIIGEGTPVIIPENGPIALNFPLTPARRGSCSTRTVHPHFIGCISDMLSRVGLDNPIYNPYELMTKGEMVEGCRDQDFLSRVYPLTRSCSKFGHRSAWENKTARECGVCIPCIFRRASLHRSGRDNGTYGRMIETIDSLEKTPSDVLALISFIRRNPSPREIVAGLLGNGILPMNKMPSYAALIKRMRNEVHQWVSAKGSAYLRECIR